jgi:hypothetical protein
MKETGTDHVVNGARAHGYPAGNTAAHQVSPEAYSLLVVRPVVTLS